MIDGRVQNSHKKGAKVTRTALLKLGVLLVFVVATVGSLDTSGQLSANVRSPGYSVLSKGARRNEGRRRGVYKGDVTYPFWSHPIPKFISNQGGTTPADLSYVATLPLGGYSFEPHGSVGHYTGQDGPQ